MRRFSIVAIVLFACGGATQTPVAPPATVQTAPAASSSVRTVSELPLHFRGNWRDPGEQIVFSFDLRLERSGNALKGRILWTLLATPPGHPLESRVNEVGTEYVKGTWDPEKRLVTLEGTHVDGTLLATDQYKLTVADDGSGFTGKTRGNKGLWMNEIAAEAAEP